MACISFPVRDHFYHHSDTLYLFICIDQSFSTFYLLHRFHCFSTKWFRHDLNKYATVKKTKCSAVHIVFSRLKKHCKSINAETFIDDAKWCIELWKMDREKDCKRPIFKKLKLEYWNAIMDASTITEWKWKWRISNQISAYNSIHNGFSEWSKITWMRDFFSIWMLVCSFVHFRVVFDEATRL